MNSSFKWPQMVLKRRWKSTVRISTLFELERCFQSLIWSVSSCTFSGWCSSRTLVQGTGPRTFSICLLYLNSADIAGPLQSMIMLSTSLGVGLAFLLCGSVSLNAGFHYVLVVLIFTIIHMYQHFSIPQMNVIFRFFTYGSFFWHKRVTERSGEELKGWTIIANTQVLFQKILTSAVKMKYKLSTLISLKVEKIWQSLTQSLASLSHSQRNSREQLIGHFPSKD